VARLWAGRTLAVLILDMAPHPQAWEIRDGIWNGGQRNKTQVIRIAAGTGTSGEALLGRGAQGGCTGYDASVSVSVSVSVEKWLSRISAHPALSASRSRSITSRGASIEAASPAIDSASPSIEAASPSIDSAGPSVDLAGPSIDLTGP